MPQFQSRYERVLRVKGVLRGKKGTIFNQFFKQIIKITFVAFAHDRLSPDLAIKYINDYTKVQQFLITNP